LTAGEFVTGFLTAALTNLDPSIMIAVDQGERRGPGERDGRAGGGPPARP
jgi:hypothetical protein